MISKPFYPSVRPVLQERNKITFSEHSLRVVPISSLKHREVITPRCVSSCLCTVLFTSEREQGSLPLTCVMFLVSPLLQLSPSPQTPIPESAVLFCVTVVRVCSHYCLLCTQFSCKMEAVLRKSSLNSQYLSRNYRINMSCECGLKN